jgi:hypothetical protein
MLVILGITANTAFCAELQLLITLIGERVDECRVVNAAMLPRTVLLLASRQSDGGFYRQTLWVPYVYCRRLMRRSLY